jgi:hypothetical protein
MQMVSSSTDTGRHYFDTLAKSQGEEKEEATTKKKSGA